MSRSGGVGAETRVNTIEDVFREFGVENLERFCSGQHTHPNHIGQLDVVDGVAVVLDGKACGQKVHIAVGGLLGPGPLRVLPAELVLNERNILLGTAGHKPMGT